MIDNGKWSKENEDAICGTRDNIIDMALNDGHSMIVDDTNYAQVHIDRMEYFASVYGIELVTKEFKTAPKECVDRDALRPNPVGAKVIYSMYDKYCEPEPITPYLIDETLPLCIICDIDGTLAHLAGRSPYDYTKVDTDIVDTTIKELVNRHWNHNDKVFIFSGRDGVCGIETANWLNDNGIKYDELRIRKEGDERKDRIVKEEMFDKHIRGVYNVLCVYDDRNQVVDMWREMGLKCLQVQPGNF